MLHAYGFDVVDDAQPQLLLCTRLSTRRYCSSTTSRGARETEHTNSRGGRGDKGDIRASRIRRLKEICEVGGYVQSTTVIHAAADEEARCIGLTVLNVLEKEFSACSDSVPV